MRKVKISSIQQEPQKFNNLLQNKSAKITFSLSATLLQELENFIRSRWTQGDYTYSNLSAVVRQSLVAYQNGKIKLATEKLNKIPKRNLTIRFTSSDLLNFYYSLPFGHRTDILERSLISYWQKIKKK